MASGLGVDGDFRSLSIQEAGERGSSGDSLLQCLTLRVKAAKEAAGNVASANELLIL